MNSLTIFEFDKLVESEIGVTENAVPHRVFAWLESQCLEMDGNASGWLKHAKFKGQRAFQVTGFAGVVRAPCGFQIEILPKIGRNSSVEEARGILIEMLQCLLGFRHIRMNNADMEATKMPLMEVFIQEFLAAAGSLVRRGLRSDYIVREDNLFALRGRLLVAEQVVCNLLRPDRFYTQHEEFSANRAENRLLHSALRRVLSITRSQENQRVARELAFVFSEVPVSSDTIQDMKRIRLDRGMGYYGATLDWAKLVLQGMSPLSISGEHSAPSLLFPMEALFEAYVRRHLSGQLRKGFAIKAQVNTHHLVSHNDQNWFRLKPDLLVKEGLEVRLVLDTKWKLLDESKRNATEKYQLSQADFYQLFAYGQHYLNGRGDVVLIYPKTDSFTMPLPVFGFPMAAEMRLWVLPFCFKKRQIQLPQSARLEAILGCVRESM